jgi:transcriptional regulator with XRE-family HTH domain
MARVSSAREGDPVGLEEHQEVGNLRVTPLDRPIARRHSGLRAGQDQTLEVLARREGISRASLSRLERCELSPTATMLFNLCGQYGWTLSRLMAEAESGRHRSFVRRIRSPGKTPSQGMVAASYRLRTLTREASWLRSQYLPARRSLMMYPRCQGWNIIFGC